MDVDAGVTVFSGCVRPRTMRRSSVGYTLVAAITASIALSIALSIVRAPARVAAQSSDTDAAQTQELADRYAPDRHAQGSGGGVRHDGEPFAPMAVDAVLDNRADRVASGRQRRSDGDARPDARATCSSLGEGFYLDFPGDSLQPGCLYERDFERYAGAAARPCTPTSCSRPTVPT